jgi:hypothetical protein
MIGKLIDHLGFGGRIERVASAVERAVCVLAQPTNLRMHWSGGGQRFLKLTSTPAAP